MSKRWAEVEMEVPGIQAFYDSALFLHSAVLLSVKLDHQVITMHSDSGLVAS